MSRLILILCVLSIPWRMALSEETDVSDTAEAAAETEQGDGIESPRTLSGMSILGNEEAPKALVIVPWKSSELGEDISLSDTLDDRARPVDKEVFLRELAFYEIRSGAEPQDADRGAN